MIIIILIIIIIYKIDVMCYNEDVFFFLSFTYCRNRKSYFTAILYLTVAPYPHNRYVISNKLSV